MRQMLWRRHLTDYPDTPTRAAYLTLVVLAAVIVFYEFYVAAAVAPAIIAGFGMTFRFYVYTIAVACAAGALGSLAAGVADRWGRANLVAYGLMANGVLTLFGITNVGGKWSFAVVFAIIGYISGVILVATPALVRDFAQRLGRASAMGLWALGPVAGSLAVALVSSLTLGTLHPWRDQFVIAGLAGLAAGLIAVLFLKELHPHLRERIQDAMRERALAEARVRGVDLDASLERPWRQVLRPGIAGPALGCALLLLVYYTAVVFFPLYFSTARGFSLASANSLGDWLWAFTAAALLLAGIASDATGVRKPFMVIGAVGAIGSTLALAELGPGTPYGTIALTVGVLGVFLGIAFGPWMAGFTEAVERRSPALTGTGLAVWSWTVWAVVVISLLIVPSAVPSLASVTGTQWRDWLWACAAGQVLFLPTVFLLSGRWNPRQARLDAEAHELRVQAELQSLAK